MGSMMAVMSASLIVFCTQEKSQDDIKLTMMIKMPRTCFSTTVSSAAPGVSIIEMPRFDTFRNLTRKWQS